MTISVSNCKCRCIRRLDTHTLICIIHTTSVRKSYLSQKKLLCSTVFLADVPSVTKNIKTMEVYGGPHKAGGFGIVNCNPRCTYCPLVPKRDTFYVTGGSPMFSI